MATGTNGIATIADCNNIVSNSFVGYDYSISSSTYSTYNAISNNVASFGYEGYFYVQSTNTSHAIINTPCTFNFTITPTIKENTASGSTPSIKTYVSPHIRVGIKTSTSTSASYVKYVNIYVSPTGNTTGSIDIPYGNYYLFVQCVSTGTISLTSTTATTLYQGWSFSGTFNWDSSWCPTYSAISGTGYFNISGSYTSSQCVKYSSLRKKVGYISYTTTDNSSGNIIQDEIVYSSSALSISSISAWTSYCGTNWVDFQIYSVGNGVFELSPAGAVNWESGYYYFVVYGTTYGNHLYRIYISSTQASSLNNGTNLTLSGSRQTTLS